jgi:Tol biopolymer transport system component
VAASTLGDFGPAFAPDGRRFAFESARAGETNEIWLADADGSHPVQLTRGPGGWQGSPAWSPDGRLVAFDSRGSDGFSDVWVIAPDGSGLRQVTHGALDDAHPTWSSDGKWIYYRDHRPDGHDLRRVPIAGGASELVARDGFRGVEADDGRTIVFTVTDDESPLVAQPLAGGERRTLAECAITRSVARGPDGIYYIACPAEAPEGDVYRVDAATGVRRRLGTAGIGGGFVPGLTVAPDGRRILFTKQVGDGSDLMLVEGFR